MEEETFNKLLKDIHDPCAFDTLYKFYYPKIVRHIISKFRRKDLGEDVAQEFFIKLIRLEFEYVRRPASWIYVSCDNIARDFLNNDKKYNMAFTEDEKKSEEAFEHLIFGEFRDTIKSLEPDTYEIIVKHYFEGYSLKEISEITGMNYNTVRQKCSRGLKKLKEISKKRNKTR